eukprot:TRINITY_DN285_c0_g2_i1.p1 TRINITY_DN285_c0_g2~~TRINITY_DN285_c0_g2_i1.p1  ORF type:complete len:401 (+),score=128.02 TRINITY_DN285_c0_g2_i1:62-1204(+)
MGCSQSKEPKPKEQKSKKVKEDKPEKEPKKDKPETDKSAKKAEKAEGKTNFEPLSGVKDSVFDCIGDTPIVWLNRVPGEECGAKIAVKLESENPANSVKDRLGLAIIKDAEEKGLLTPGKSTIVEATSGNTGIALSMCGAARGYRVILTMPESMSIERRCMLRAYGAELVLTPAAKGMKGAINKAAKIVAETEGAINAKQFETPANAKIHEETTGPEIWKATEGNIDFFVAGVGTGGTITGVSRFLKAKGSNCTIVGVEPAESAVLSGGAPGPHKIQGIGAGFKPDILEMDLVSEVVAIPQADAMEMGVRMPKEEGLMVGISSGAIVQAAIQVGSRPENKGKTIVAMIPSFGERYLSTAMFADLKSTCEQLPVCSEEECS